MRTTVLTLLAALMIAALVAVGCGGEEEEMYCYEEDGEVVCVSADESVGKTTQAIKKDPFCDRCHGLRRPSARATYEALATLGQLRR